MKKITLFLALALISLAVQAQAISFESDEGYEIGNVDGQNGWLVPSTNAFTVSEEQASDGDWSLKIGSAGIYGGGATLANTETIDQGIYSFTYDVFVSTESVQAEGQLRPAVLNGSSEAIAEMIIESGKAFGNNIIGGERIGEKALEVDQWNHFQMILNFDEEKVQYIANDELMGETDLVGEYQMTYLFTYGSSTYYVDNMEVKEAGNLAVNPIHQSTFDYYIQNNKLTLSSNLIINKVMIYNVLGQNVINRSFNAKSAAVNLGSLNSGIYFAKIQVGQELKTFKFSK